MSAAIELSEVHVAYPAADAEPRDVLTGISASIAVGSLCALLGPNGSGKSTLIRAVAGLVPARKGLISLGGQPVLTLSREERAKTVALVPQRIEIAFGFSVRQVVAMGRAPYQGTFMRERIVDREAVDAALEDCALTELQHRPIAELSGGEQQRVHVARAFAQQPAILLLDEAAAHLDVRHAESLYALVRSQMQQRELTCVAAMHDFNAALRHADTALVLDRGEIAGDGPASSILEPELLSRVFGVQLALGALEDGGQVLAVIGKQDDSG
jgi:iron complex transport system ATP-binding protein